MVERLRDVRVIDYDFEGNHAMPERTELRSLARARTAGAAAAAADQLSGEAVEMVIRAKDASCDAEDRNVPSTPAVVRDHVAGRRR